MRSDEVGPFAKPQPTPGPDGPCPSQEGIRPPFPSHLTPRIPAVLGTPPEMRLLNRALPMFRNECLQHGLPQQSRWEQPLGQNEVVKGLLIEALA